MAGEKETEDINLESQPNPINSTNFLSKVFFCWLLPLFKFGFKNTLDRKHLFQTVSQDSSKHLAEKLIREWESELEKEKKTGEKASLFKAISRTCWVLVFLNGFIVFFEECIFKMGQPILLGFLVQYFNENSHITTTQAYLCAFGMTICAVGITILHHPSFFISARVGMRIRIAVSALVYRKALKLSNSALGKTTVGQLVNILSNDVNRFDLALLFFHYMWIAPIQIITMLCVLWFEMGPTCLIAFFTLLLMAPVQAFMGKMFSQLRAKTALLTDERVRIMNEIIAGMRIIKIHAWEVPFTKLVEEARRCETRLIHLSSACRSFNVTMYDLGPRIIAFATFTAYGAAGNVVHSSLVFRFLSWLFILRFSISTAIPMFTMSAVETFVSIKRLQKEEIMEKVWSTPSQQNLEIQNLTPQDNIMAINTKRESLRIQRTSYLRSMNLAFFFISSKIVAFTTFTLFAALGNVITTTVVFVAIPMFDIVRLTVTLFVPYCIMHWLEGLVSIKRIKAFLIMDELQPSTGALDLSVSKQNHLYHGNGDAVPLQEEGSDSNHTNHHMGDSIRANGNGVTCAGDTNGEAMVVVDPETKLAISVTGKDVNSKGGDDYCVQTKDLKGSWDEEDTGTKCLDGVTFSVKRQELVAVIGPVGCGKSSLFMALLGELPNITGQISVKGRVAYTSQQPWVFSGTLKENILFGRPYDKHRYQRALSICALTRDIAILPHGDLTLIGERGITLSGGQRARVSLARAVYDDADIYLLDDPLSAVDTAVGRHLFDRCISGHLKSKSVILITHQLQYLHTVDKIVVLKEGEMVDCGTYEELQKKGIDFAALLKNYEDETQEVDDDTAGKLSRTQSVTSRESETASPEDVAFTDNYSEVERKETKKEGSVNKTVYAEFFRAGGSLPLLFFFMVFNLAAQVFFVLTDWWLSEWAYIEESCASQFEADRCLYEPAVLGNFTDFRVDKIGRPFFFYIFATFTFLLIVFAFSRTLWLFYILVTASKNLHNQMFAAIIRTPMQFFDNNPIGRILNRFSKDIGFMDELLPITMADFNAITIQTVAILITICIFNPLVLIFTVPLGFLFVFVRSFFLSTSRDVKRIEGTSRSPVFSHLSSTLQGLTTVRAFHAQNRFVAKFDMYQDVHTQSWFAFLATTRWFQVMLDWLTTAFLIVVAFGSVLSKDLLSLNAAEVGLSLTYALSLMGAFQWGVRQSAEVENLMTSTERVIEYTKLKPEADVESKEKLDPEWPKEGAVEFNDVSLRYSEDGPLVLKGINMTIAPKEKIGIVGRTGAGKSSLTVALMRLVEPMGTIKIDGVDLLGLGLHDVRKNVAFIPQDPTLFSGTLRRNLDPFSDHDDESLWGALKEVQLQPVVEEYPEKLEMKVSEGGNNFSVGQRQLLCLARAVLRKNRVLLVDEATANVDIRTDALIQATIREKFKDCTVFTIAHRLNTIMDSDRVLVLEEGQVVEFDKPHILLQRSNGFLLGMVAETGNQESNKLKAIAKQKYFEMEQGEENDEASKKGEVSGDEGTCEGIVVEEHQEDQQDGV